MKTQTYYFFFEINNTYHAHEELECKSPRSTKVYKELGDAFNKGIITGYGYTNYKTDY